MTKNEQIRRRRVSYCSTITICHIKLLRPWRQLLELVGNYCYILTTVKALHHANFISLDHWKNFWKDLNLMTIKTFSSTHSELLQHLWQRFLCHGLHDDSWNAWSVVSTCRETYWKVVKTFSCWQLLSFKKNSPGTYWTPLVVCHTCRNWITE